MNHPQTQWFDNTVVSLTVLCVSGIQKRLGWTNLGVSHAVAVLSGWHWRSAGLKVGAGQSFLLMTEFTKILENSVASKFSMWSFYEV